MYPISTLKIAIGKRTNTAKMKRSSFLIIVSTLFLQSCAQPKLSWNEFENKFSTGLKEDLKSNGVVGASYAVFDDKNIVWNDSYGFADKSKNESASINTRYLIGSVTKVFTAAAILQLQEKGMLNIDSCVSCYLPGFAIKQRFPHSKPITVRDVLTHHAGLPTDIFLHKFAEKPPYFDSILDYLNNKYTCFPVGEIKSYSNIGYALLGMIVEKVSGISYQDYVEKNIFSPLAMTNSGFFTSMDLKDEISHAYTLAGEVDTELPIFDLPAGAIYSTVGDMVKFGKSFLNKGSPILKPETIRLMFEIQNKDIQLDLYEKSAVCFTIKNKAGELGRVFEHGGATMYQRADLYLAPDANLGCVMLSNSPEGVKNAWKLNEQFMVEYVKQHNIKVEPHTIPEKNFSFTSVKNKNLKSFAGNYAMPGMSCTFQWKHDYLYVTIQGNSFYLIPADDHSFVAAKRILGFMFKSKAYHFFLEEINGRKLFIQAMPWGELTIIGAQIEKKNIPRNWEKRIGRYELVNQKASELQMINNVQIINKNGFLTLSYKFNAISNTDNAAEMTLDITDSNKAFTRGLGSGGGESVVFSTDENSNDEFFEYYGLQFRLFK
jgi:CubicO group peptidase (beta-lactamase class C family)